MAGATKKLFNEFHICGIFFSRVFVFCAYVCLCQWACFLAEGGESESAKAYAHLEAGNQCRLIEDIVCAEEHFRQALVIDPEYGHALSNLGVLMVEREKYQEAQVLLEKAIRVDPTRATVYGNRIFLAEKNRFWKGKNSRMEEKS